MYATGALSARTTANEPHLGASAAQLLAVMAGGQCGFRLGATPNAVANMNTLVEKFGPTPRAFLVIPMVGAFFIDFTNAIIITFFMNLVK